MMPSAPLSPDVPTRRVLDAGPAPRSQLATAIVPVTPPTGAKPPDVVPLTFDSDDPFDPAPPFPEVGNDIHGFRLVDELGRGAFGRVYLARQGDLAGRHIALKLGINIVGESRTLAQLQHANIVPIYSAHRIGPFHAVCMPYFGRTTLAQVVQHISGRAHLPSSGRELRSTIERTATAETLSANSSSAPSSEPAGPLPEPYQPPVPAIAPGDPAGWTRLEELSYVGAVLWLGVQLADGLAHAHARGVLHRDLKPANVLLADDGRPMLLDFNLAEDLKTRDSAKRAAVGGTLPYMAPEQMVAFRDRVGAVDERSDLFSLGVILAELLTGRHPYPIYRGAARDIITTMISDRMNSPQLRQWNPAVSPAVEAIVLKCLAPNSADRYACAEQLREDLDRQLHHQPLRHTKEPSSRERARKWMRRHPRLASSGTVAVLATVMIAALGAGVVHSREQTKDLHARTQLADHGSTFRDVQLVLDDRNQSRPHLNDSLDKLRGVLARYGVPEDGTDESWLAAPDVTRLPEERRTRLRGDIGETFYQMAEVSHLRAAGESSPEVRDEHLRLADRWNAAAVRYSGSRLPRAIREQQARLSELRGDRAAADRLRAEAAAIPLDSPRDLFLLGHALSQRGQFRDALPHLRDSTQLEPGDFSAWFVRGSTHLAVGQPEMAAMCFGGCLAIRDDFAPAWLSRGVAFKELRFYSEALADFDRAIRIDPKLERAYVARADVQAMQGNWKAAEADYTRALETGSATVRVFFLRASVRDRLNDTAGAKADRAKGFSLTAADELSWLARAENRAENDPKGALTDVEEALKVNPFCVPALQMKAYLFAEKLGRAADALTALDRAVELNPDSAPAIAGRGVLLARQGKRDPAIRDAKDSLVRDTRAPNQYQVACIFALTSAKGTGHAEDRAEAFRLLWASLKTGFALDIVDTDTDLDPIRKDAEFQRVVTAARAYHEASKR